MADTHTRLQELLRDTYDAVGEGGMRLFQQLLRSKTPDEKNCFCSPFSISAALTLALLGARPGSQTHAALRRVLLPECETVNEEELVECLREMMSSSRAKLMGVEMCVANSAWVRGDVASTFKKAMSKRLDADVYKLTTTKEINRWCERKTSGMIKHLLDDVPPLTQAVLLNAVYFKATWQHAFDSQCTRDGVFRTFGGSHLPCKMMSQFFSSVACGQTNGVTFACLPYGTGECVGILALPDDEEPAALDRFIESINIAWLKQAVRTTKRRLVLTMPRLSLEYSTSLRGMLQALGAEQIFCEEAGNGFLRVNESAEQPLYVSDVLHKSYAVVNEKGTKAAAATAVTMVLRSACSPTTHSNVVLTLDRPFFFAIFDHLMSQLVFVGRVTQPDVANVATEL